MRTVTLTSLEIANFKGIASLRLDFDGRSACIHGANGTGKSSVSDAWSWLLFGKNAHGSADFSIKPLGDDGSVRDSGASTIVTAEIAIDGDVHTLRRVYYEKWSQKRGSVNKTFDGNTTEFYIDGVPRKKSEFDTAVRELIAPEDVFLLVTRLTAFSESLSWQKRRQVLFGLLDLQDDHALMSADERFKPLADALGSLTLDDLRRKLTSSRRQWSEEKNALPKRIDEVTAIARDLRAVDYDELRAQLTSMSERRDSLAAELIRLDNDSAAVSLHNNLAAVRNELTALELRNREYRAAQSKPVDNSADELYAMRCREAERVHRDALAKQADTECAISELMEKRQLLRDQYAAFYASTLPASELTCPTCGRPYDEAARKAATERFEKEKQAQLHEIAESGKTVGGKIEELQRELIDQNAAVEAAERELERVKSDKPVHEPTPVVVDIDSYAADKERLKAAESALLIELDRLTSDADSVRGRLLRQIEELKQSMAEVNGKLGGESVLKTTEARIAELNDRAREISAALEDCDRLMWLSDEFTRYKVSFIEESVNSRFQYARFKLFDQQVNGALVDCCVATYQGVPYEDVNTSMQMNLGLDIIGVISGHYGVRVPLFCDNAESVSEFIPVDTQTIRLKVSENDKELRCELL